MKTSLSSLAGILCLGSLIALPDLALADVSVTAATGGANLSSDIAANATSPGWSNLTDIVIAEANGAGGRDDFHVTVGAGTLILKAPAGFQFDTGAPAPVVTATGGTDISSPSGQVTDSSTLTVTFTVGGTANNNTLRIAGVRARPTAGSPIATARHIYRPSVGGGSAVIDSIVTSADGSSGHDFGSLSQIVGAIQKLTFTTQPGSATVGASFGVQPVIRTQDQFGNNSTTGLGATLNVTVSLTSGTGPLLGTVVRNIGTGGGNGIVTHTDLRIDNAGSGKQLTASASGLVSAVSASFTVNGLNTTTTAANQSASYNPAVQNVTLSATVSPAQNEGTVTFTVLQGATPIGTPVISSTLAAGSASVSYGLPAGLPVGTYTINASYSGSATYNPSSDATKTLTINPADQAISFGALANKTYGDAPFTLTASASSGLAVGFSVVSGPASLSGNVLTISGAGSVTIRASQPGNASYNPAPTVDRSFTVLPAALVVTANSANRLYGAANPPLSGSVVGLVNGDIITATFSTAADATSPVGSYPITASLSDPGGKLGNYSVNSINGALTVTPAPLLGTADNKTRAYGAANPTFTATYTGFVNGQDASLVTGTLVGTTAADETSSVGTYPISVSGQSAPNYSISYADGVLTVANAVLTINGDNAARAYGAANPALTGSLVGLQNGDNITATFSTEADALSLVGGYVIDVALTDPDNKLPNYTTVTNLGSLTINPAALTVTADNQTRLYGAANPTLTGSVVGLVNGDNVTATFSTTADASSPVGSYPITSSLSDPDGKLSNYTVSSVNGTLTVTAAPLLGTADNKNRLYGAANPAFTVTYTGFVNGEDASIVTGTLVGTTPADETSPVGTYPISVSGQTAPNYSITYADGLLTINPAGLTVTADNQTRPYGAPNPALTGSVVGLVNGDNITATFSTTADATSPVGSHAITSSLNDPDGKLGNYTVSSINGTLTVTPVALTVTANNASRPYGAANPTLTGSVVGLLNGDNITASFSSTANALSPVGPYPITSSLSDPDGKLGNYTPSSINGTLTVTPAPLLGTAANKVRAYGEPNPTFTVTYTGFVNGEDDSIVTGTLVGTTPADETSPVGTYPISVSGQSAPNYSITYVDGVLTVANAVLTINGDNAARAYGAANPALTGSLVGLQAGDNITATFSTMATAASPVGSYVIDVALVDPDNKLGNYAVVTNLGSLTVNTVGLTVTADNASRAYGAANPTFTGSVVGLVNGDNITATFSTTADATSPVGGHPITSSLNDPDGKLGNYTVSSVNGTLTITAIPLTVTADNASRAYGAANPALTGSVVGLVNGDNITATFSTAADATSPVGAYPITSSLNDPDGKSGNYTVSSIAGSLSVTPAPLTVTGGDASRLYGAPNPTLTGSIVGLVNGDNITATYATIATAASPVGVYPITATLLDPDTKLPNYNVTPIDGSLTVLQAPLVITAVDQSKLYGADLPLFTASYSGFVNGDTPASLDVPVILSTAATAASSVGTYPITATGAADANYAITFVPGTLTVLPALLVITANDQTKVYGADLPTLSASYSGLVNGDTEADLDTPVSLTTTATAASNVGTYPISGAGAADANYTISFTGGTLTVTRAPLTITADDKTKEYLSVNPPLTATYVGFVNGDTIASLDVAASLSTTADILSPIGTYPITVSAAADGNYEITFVNGTLTVTPLSLQLSVISVTGGDVILRITGQPGQTLDIEESSDFETWSQVAQVINSTGALHYTHVGGGNAPLKFYRLHVIE